MAAFPAVTVQSGGLKRAQSADDVAVGLGVDTTAAGLLTLGRTLATATAVGPGPFALSGSLRLGAGAVCKGREAGNTFDVQVFTVGVMSGQVVVGDPVNGSSLIFTPASTIYFRPGGIADAMYINSTNVFLAQPVIGDTGKPYAVHGKVNVATAGDFTIASADIGKDSIRLTDNTGNNNVTFAQPSSDARAYTKFVGNASALFIKTITTGAGATVALAPLTGARIRFDNTVGCTLESAGVAVS